MPTPSAIFHAACATAVLGGGAAIALAATGCTGPLSRSEVEDVIRRDAKELSATSSEESFMAVQLTGYVVNPAQRWKVEFMKSLPELFTLESFAERPARDAFASFGEHYELLDLAADRKAMHPVPAQPDRLLQHYAFAVSRPELAASIRQEEAVFPLRDWELVKVTLGPHNPLTSMDFVSAWLVVTKRPNETSRLVRRALARTPLQLVPHRDARGQVTTTLEDTLIDGDSGLELVGLWRLPRGPDTVSFQICLNRYESGWHAHWGCT